MKTLRAIFTALSLGLIVAGVIALLWAVTKVVAVLIILVLAITAASYIKW